MAFMLHMLSIVVLQCLANECSLCASHKTVDAMPANPAMSECASAISVAHNAMNLPDSVVLMVVNSSEGNYYDQQV